MPVSRNDDSTNSPKSLASRVLRGLFAHSLRGQTRFRRYSHFLPFTKERNTDPSRHDDNKKWNVHSALKNHTTHRNTSLGSKMRRNSLPGKTISIFQLLLVLEGDLTTPSLCVGVIRPSAVPSSLLPSGGGSGRQKSCVLESAVSAFCFKAILFQVTGQEHITSIIYVPTCPSWIHKDRIPKILYCHQKKWMVKNLSQPSFSVCGEAPKGKRNHTFHHVSLPINGRVLKPRFGVDG